MRLPWRTNEPPELAGRLAADELVTAAAATEDGIKLITTRRGLWTINGADVEMLGWDRVAKARLESGVLTVVAVQDVVTWPDGTVVVRDTPAVQYRLLKPAKVTDQVHTRVRRSVAASRHLPWPRSGGWVALRRVPGVDGLVIQVRLDPGSDPDAPGFADAVAELAADLRGSRPVGITGVDD